MWTTRAATGGEPEGERGTNGPKSGSGVGADVSKGGSPWGLSQ